MRSYLVGRQPIVNRQEELVAFELLFRRAGVQTLDVEEASHWTASVIVNTLTVFGIDDLLGGHKGFINLELQLLMDDSLNILPRRQVGLELLETLQVTPELIERCRLLKESGFTLALDDHEYSPLFHELYDIVDIVKIDLIKSTPAQRAEMVKQFKRYRVQLLAEKVETREEFNSCLEQGFDLFQGYYIAKPLVMEKRRLDDCGATLLKLMRLLTDDAELAEIEKTFRGSVVLTYKLLLLVNSVGIGMRSKIETVRHAISVLGRRQIQRWIHLALFAGNDPTGKANPLMDMAAVRAGFMENLAACHPALLQQPDATEKAFMTGILSILEAVYDIPMAEVTRELNLSTEVNAALTLRQGTLGKLLHVAVLLEELEFDHLCAHLDEMGISVQDALESQRKAYAWRRELN